jgi:hypothetical protein
MNAAQHAPHERQATRPPQPLAVVEFTEHTQTVIMLLIDKTMRRANRKAKL